MDLDFDHGTSPAQDNARVEQFSTVGAQVPVHVEWRMDVRREETLRFSCEITTVTPDRPMPLVVG
jgi:hypothetical protein